MLEMLLFTETLKNLTENSLSMALMLSEESLGRDCQTSLQNYHELYISRNTILFLNISKSFFVLFFLNRIFASKK